MLTEEEKKAKRAAYRKDYYEANKEKRAAYKKAYRKANKEKISAYNKDYREANKERLAAYRKAHRKANKEKESTREKAYRKANPEIVAKKYRKRRATKKEVYVPRCSYWEGVEKQLMEERERLRATGIIYHIDHIYPLSKGGIDHPSNYQLLTPEENLSKGDKVDSCCPRQMRMKEVSNLVLNRGMDIDSALQLTKKRKTYGT